MASKKIQIVGLDIPQSDWNQTDETKLDYIKNKPDLTSISGFITENDVDKKIAELDVDDTAVAHQVVTTVSETDGKISVTRKQLTTDDLEVGTEDVWIFDCGTSAETI